MLADNGELGLQHLTDDELGLQRWRGLQGTYVELGNITDQEGHRKGVERGEGRERDVSVGT